MNNSGVEKRLSRQAPSRFESCTRYQSSVGWGAHRAHPFCCFHRLASGFFQGTWGAVWRAMNGTLRPGSMPLLFGSSVTTGATDSARCLWVASPNNRPRIILVWWCPRTSLSVCGVFICGVSDERIAIRTIAA